MKRSTRKGSRANQRIPPQGGASASGLQNVLIAVTGMSPAVLTETVWALSQESSPVIPDQVIPITTIAGRQAIERELLTANHADVPSVWQQLRQAVLGPGCESDPRLMLCPARVVEAPNPRTGRADWLEDLRTPEENGATADFLLSEVRRWSETPEVRLVFSIAGGRKTMGALLCSCAMLLGRAGDRLTHVLVNEPYDDPRLAPRFYFNEQAYQQLRSAAGIVKAAEARVELADIPFVPLRALFEKDLVRRPAGFTELVRRCSGSVDELAARDVRVELSRRRRRLRVNGTTVDTSVRQHLLLLFLAERLLNGDSPLPSYAAGCTDFLNFCKRVHGQRDANDFSDWRHDAELELTLEEMERLCVKVKNELKEKLRKAGPAGMGLYRALPEGGRFSLALPAASVSIKD